MFVRLTTAGGNLRHSPTSFAKGSLFQYRHVEHAGMTWIGVVTGLVFDMAKLPRAQMAAHARCASIRNRWRKR